eukprot:m.493376 g.493376  ORF g.493376 m.493376 type:complete len:574 (+) comp21793_c0_seq4:238-1959(+)
MMTNIARKIICCVASSLILVSGTTANVRNSPIRPNVVYIVVDDLRPELPIYGQDYVYAPHLSALAARGLTFDHAYCQQAVCSPSRNSFMSGRRPDKTQVWNFLVNFRDVGPKWTTLPGVFKKNGYLTLGTGKLFHEGEPANGDGSHSWTNVSVQFNCNTSSADPPGHSMSNAFYCDPEMISCTNEGNPSAPHPRWCAIANTTLDGVGGDFADIDTLDNALSKLDYAIKQQRETNEPWFLGVGLRKPHLDWRFPKPFLDFYPAVEHTKLPRHAVLPPGVPDIAYHSVSRSDNEAKLWDGWGYIDPWTPMRNSTVQAMRLHYYAATSFMDSLVGKLLAAIDAHGVTASTIVVFHADHGWALGESGMYRKFHNSELSTRVPLVVAVPWMPSSHGLRTRAIVELIDIMPTLMDLANISLPMDEPTTIDGESFAHVLADFGGTDSVAAQAVSQKSVAISQYPRCPQDTTHLWRSNWCEKVDANAFGWMGYTIRNATWRYTAWFPWNGTLVQPIVAAAPPRNGTGGFYHELYNYEHVDTSDFDSFDTIEVSASNAAVVAELYATLLKVAGLGPFEEHLR